MKKALIENYRGFDIEFDIDSEKFMCVCSDDDSKESKSFTAIKKFIDDYKKTNQDFKPFMIEPTPQNIYSSVTYKVIGMRKDGKFIAEKPNGTKVTIANYDLTGYMIVNPVNQDALKKLKELNADEEAQKLKIKETRNLIISGMSIVTLEDFKNSL